MTLRTIACITIICDGCGLSAAPGEDGEHAHYESAGQAIEHLDMCGGAEVGGRHWCAGCIAEGKAPAEAVEIVRLREEERARRLAEARARAQREARARISARESA